MSKAPTLLLCAFASLLSYACASSTPVTELAEDAHQPRCLMGSNATERNNKPFDAFEAGINGYWVHDNDLRNSYWSLGLLERESLVVRSAGINGFGGVVPIIINAVEPNVFDISGLGRVTFVSDTCATVEGYRNTSTTYLLKEMDSNLQRTTG